MSALIPIILAATIPLRNPFWPLGYVGEREAISDKPRIQVKALTESAAEEDTKTSVTEESLADAEAAANGNQNNDRIWIAARKSLKIGGTMRTESENGSHQSVTINGNIYADGDLVSINMNGKRFTWRVKNLSNGGTLKLQRIKIRELNEDAETKGE